MTVHTDRIVLVFPIAAKNRNAAASLQTLTIYEDGSEREQLVPLDPEAVSQYASDFNLGLIAERDALQVDLQAITAERDTLAAEVARLTALVPPLREDYQVTKAEFIARLQQADPQILVDIWKSQSAESILAAVSLFTHDGVIDLRPGQRTHLMLQSLIPLGIITQQQVESILIEV